MNKETNKNYEIQVFGEKGTIETYNLTKISLQRWRALGLLGGIRKNSKMEKEIAASMEMVAMYLVKHHFGKKEGYKNFISNDNNDVLVFANSFETWIFPFLRLIRGGVNGGIKPHINHIVSVERLIGMLKNITLNNIEDDIVKIVTQKKYNETVWMYFSYMRMRGLGDTPVTAIDFEKLRNVDYLLGDLVKYRKGNESNKKFDVEAEVLRLIASYVIKKINEEDKNKKQ